MRVATIVSSLVAITAVVASISWSGQAQGHRSGGASRAAIDILEITRAAGPLPELQIANYQ